MLRFKSRQNAFLKTLIGARTYSPLAGICASQIAERKRQVVFGICASTPFQGTDPFVILHEFAVALLSLRSQCHPDPMFVANPERASRARRQRIRVERTVRRNLS